MLNSPKLYLFWFSCGSKVNPVLSWEKSFCVCPYGLYVSSPLQNPLSPLARCFLGQSYGGDSFYVLYFKVFKVLTNGSTEDEFHVGCYWGERFWTRNLEKTQLSVRVNPNVHDVADSYKCCHQPVWGRMCPRSSWRWGVEYCVSECVTLFGRILLQLWGEYFPRMTS